MVSTRSSSSTYMASPADNSEPEESNSISLSTIHNIHILLTKLDQADLEVYILVSVGSYFEDRNVQSQALFKCGNCAVMETLYNVYVLQQNSGGPFQKKYQVFKLVCLELWILQALYQLIIIVAELGSSLLQFCEIFRYINHVSIKKRMISKDQKSVDFLFILIMGFELLATPFRFVGAVEAFFVYLHSLLLWV